MGLLNWGEWSADPDKKQSINQGLLAMGLGLLNSKGSFGNALGQAGLLGLQAQQTSYDNTLQRKFINAKLQDEQAQAAQRKAAMDAQASLRAFLESRRNPATAALAQGAEQGSIGPTVANASRMSQQGFPYTFQDVVTLKTLGGPDLLEAWKVANDPLKLEGGATYRDRLTGAERFMPKVDNGITMTNGQAAPVPGYAGANAAIKGAEAAAVEAAKAGYDFVDAYDPNAKQPVKVRRDIAAGQAPRPGMQIPPEEQRSANVGALRIMQDELARATSPADRAALQREIARLQSTGSPTGVSGNAASAPIGLPTGPSARDTAVANYDRQVQEDFAARRKSILDAGDAATSKLGTYAQLQNLLLNFDGGALSPAGFQFARTMNSLGLKVDPKLSNKEAASALANQMALELRNPAGGAGLPGAMSDADRQFLASMVPGLATSAQGRQLILTARMAVERRNQEVATAARNYEKKYGRLDNGFFEQLQAWSAANPLFKAK